MMKNRGKILTLALLLTVLAFLVGDRMPQAFDYSTSAIDSKEIMSGGPGRDGIPSLTSPEFISADEADYLKETDKVIGVNFGGKARAYPVKVLSWHEAVNDAIGPVKFLVTW